jgi:NAD(P)-dependent dehydrogenase (short-subunit alcohol dehydrogenase family)
MPNLARKQEDAMYLDKFRLDGKTALITGAARGIGFATADALSEAGALVIIADMDGAAADKAASALIAKGRKAEAVRLDVTRSGDVDSVHASRQ